MQDCGVDLQDCDLAVLAMYMKQSGCKALCGVHGNRHRTSAVGPGGMHFGRALSFTLHTISLDIPYLATCLLHLAFASAVWPAVLSVYWRHIRPCTWFRAYAWCDIVAACNLHEQEGGSGLYNGFCGMVSRCRKVALAEVPVPGRCTPWSRLSRAETRRAIAV